MQSYIKRILEADVYDVAVETPLESAPLLSARLNSPVLFKREDLQPVFSFKLRGAYNRLRKLDDAARARGVVTASAGNHAQGVALAASRLGIKACIVMGKNTPDIKVKAVARLGANIILHGDSYDDAAELAHSLAIDKGYEYVHPFDDPDVIAGQGTIGMEILRQHSDPISAVFVPVGGGGLIAGIGVFVKYLRPETRVIGVESEGAACMQAALARGRRVKLRAEDLDLFADGTAVRQVGRETYRLARQCVDEVITVSVDEICAAVKDVFDDTRVLAEPSGALSVAGLKKYMEGHGAQDTSTVAIISGANVNFDRLRHISERTEIGEKREILLGVTIPETPGSFKRFCQAIGKRAVTEFNYRFSGANGAQVLVGIQTAGDDQDKIDVIEQLKQNYQVVDLSDNEVAVLHVRHMVGGRVSGLTNERLFRFEFPERPGALLSFLKLLGNRFNISMFHYRNHGSAYGRVLVGVQVPDQSLRAFRAVIEKIDYRCWDETDNPAYRMFLAG